MKRYFHIFALLFTLAPCPLAAQEASDDEARAYELNDAGIVAFGEGRFEDAARAFAEAYALNQDEALRKNEALAWFKAEECDPAVEAANKFLLVEGILESDRSDVLAVIANCKVEFARRALNAGDLDLADQMLSEAEASEPDPVVRDRVAAARVEIAQERSRREAVTQAAPIEAPPAQEQPAVEVRAPAPAPVWPVPVLAGGGATLAGTLVYHLVALGWQRQFLDMTETGGDPGRFDSLRKRVHTARILVPILYGVGTGAVVAGSWFTFVVSPPTSTGSGTIGLAAGGRF